MLLGRRGRVRLRIRAMLVGKGNLVGLRIRAVLLGRGDLVGLRIRAVLVRREAGRDSPTVKSGYGLWSLSLHVLFQSQYKHHQTILRPWKHRLRVQSCHSGQKLKFSDFMRIAALRKQLFARKSKTNWDTTLKPLPTPTNARMLLRLKWSGRSVSNSEAKISVSEVHIHARVRKVAKKVGCPRNFFYVFFFGAIYTI